MRDRTRALASADILLFQLRLNMVENTMQVSCQFFPLAAEASITVCVHVLDLTSKGAKLN